MFLVCGEALFDLFLDTDDTTDLRFSARVGGSPFNVALGLARLGQPVGFFTAISTDFLGAHLAGALETEGVSTEYLIRKNAPTTLSLVGVAADGSPSYSFYGQNAADRSIEIADVPEIDDQISALHFGSYSLVAAPTADALAALAEREAGKRLISVDPNVRLNVEPDIQVWKSRMDRLVAFADVIKISDEDIAALYPDADPRVLADGWLDQGASLVVVTRGADGVACLSHNATFETASVPVCVVDTVGAGDSFQAALLSGLNEMNALSAQGLKSLSADALGTLINFATEAAAITCSRRGADLPRTADVKVPDWKARNVPASAY